jgi:hypothetical protein
LNAISTYTPRDACPYIEVRALIGKGLGIFAKKSIPRGTRVLAESPLLRATTFSNHGVDVQTAFDNLTPREQEAFLDLHGYASETLKKDNNWTMLPSLNRKVLAIYAANRWGRDVFQLASRFNHCCIPNLHNAYNPTIQKETFHSIRDIQAGEELTVSYLFGMCARDERQKQLKSWGFQCTCPTCQDTPDGKKLEQQFVQLAFLSRQLESAVPSIVTPTENLKDYQRMAALLRSTSLVGKTLNNW